MNNGADNNQNNKKSPLAVLTLGDLRNSMLECGLPKAKADQLRSAIKRVDELIGHGALDLPANPRVLFERLDRVSPAMAGMSEQAFANTKSRLRKAFRLAKPLLANPRSRYPLKGDWAELQGALPVKLQRETSRLFHYAVAQGHRPGEVDDELIRKFELHLRDEAMVSRWENSLRTAIRGWNKCADIVGGLRKLALPAPKRVSYWVPEDQWPKSLMQDMEAFLASLAQPPSLTAPIAFEPLKPATILQYRSNIITMFSALRACGVPTDGLERLSDLVRPHNADLVMQYLYRREGERVTLQMFQIALRFRIIGRWCNASAADLERIDKLISQVRQRHDKPRGMTEKNKALMRRLDEERFRDQVQLLPIVLFDQAQKNHTKSFAPAMARTALAIELLLMTSVRRANLLGLELDKSIKRIAEGSEVVWVIVLEAGEVKNEEELRFKLPAQSAELLEAYLLDWRPRLCSTPTSWLFPDADGNCMDAKAMANAIRTQTRRVLGVPITPHQFRHISAELYLRQNPDALQTISQHLGHRDINTTRNYYARPKQLEASRRFQEEILRGRQSAGIRIRKGKDRKQPVNLEAMDWEDVL